LLFKQGQKANKLFFVLDGKLLLGKDTGFKREVITHIFFEPCIVGLDVLDDSLRFKFYAKALTPLLVMEMDGNLFNLMHRKNLQLQELIRNQLRIRLVELEGKYVLLYSGCSAFDRIKLFLIHVFSNYGESEGLYMIFNISLTHLELAQYMHTSRQSVTTMFNNLRSEGIISYTRSEFELHDLDKLLSWKDSR
jgi:CRP/FNR family transcriptional regulator